MGQTWFEFVVSVPLGVADAVANLLIECGAPGLIIEDRPDGTTIKSHWKSPPPTTALQRFCEDLGCWADTRVDLASIVDEDWAQNWKQSFEPTPVGSRLWVCPPWEAGGVEGRLSIIIDPGMAFGTGQHATTRSCLALIEDIVARAVVRRALDVGTGSGILAIALSKLGVSEVWASDIDPIARQATAQNSAANAVRENLQIVDDWRTAPRPHDLIVANLFTNLLVELSQQFASALSDDGVLLCSGFLVSDETLITSALSHAGLCIYSRHSDGDWLTIASRRCT